MLRPWRRHETAQKTASASPSPAASRSSQMTTVPQLVSRADADPLDLDAEELLEELDVGAAVLRQLLPRLGLGDVLLPAGQRLVLHLHLGQHLEVRREARQLLAVHNVAHRHLELLELVQHVELGQVEARVAVDEARVAHHDQVQPAATASAARRRAVLGSDLLQVVADLLVQLSGERTHADTRSVGLHDANHVADSGGRDTEAGEHTADGSRRARHEGVRAKVDVEEERVGTLHQHLAVLSERGVDEADAVDNVRSETLGEGPVACDLALGVVLKVPVTLEAALDELAELGGEELLVVEVVDTQTGARRLGRVGRTDALLGGADAATAELDLLEAVDNLVEVEHEVSSVRDEETAVAVEALLLDVVQLGEERRHVHHHARADESGTTRVDETRGEQVEVELGLDAVDVGDDGVAGVVAAGAACADVHLAAEHIGELAFTLIAPLGSEQDGGLAARLGVGGFWHRSHDECEAEKGGWKRVVPNRKQGLVINRCREMETQQVKMHQRRHSMLLTETRPPVKPHVRCGGCRCAWRWALRRLTAFLVAPPCSAPTLRAGRSLLSASLSCLYRPNGARLAAMPNSPEQSLGRVTPVNLF
ncbi:hypothetical protein L1887_60010 [Cichorium endivia]|nr:hypothetical protein L1887_60010 [Cichorium endivia]